MHVYYTEVEFSFREGLPKEKERGSSQGKWEGKQKTLSTRWYLLHMLEKNTIQIWFSVPFPRKASGILQKNANFVHGLYKDDMCGRKARTNKNLTEYGWQPWFRKEKKKKNQKVCLIIFIPSMWNRIQNPGPEIYKSHRWISGGYPPDERVVTRLSERAMNFSPINW